ncbi:hypothetical protein ScPMuIL_017519 [Solemya velum]
MVAKLSRRVPQAVYSYRLTNVLFPLRTKSRRSVSSGLLVISFCINVTLVVLIAYFSFVFFDKKTVSSSCVESENWDYYGNQSHIRSTSVFRDLQNSEIQEVLRFMYDQKSLKLVSAIDANLTTNFVYSVELHVPEKQEVLKFLDDDGAQQPDRQARVVVFIADPNQPTIEEYIVGSLPKPNKLSRKSLSSVKYGVRQMTFPELWEMYQTILKFDRLHEILKGSYGASLFNCITLKSKRCIVAHHMPIPTSSSGRRIRIALFYDVEYFTLFPIDFQFIINVNSFNSPDWLIEEIWHGGKIYQSVREFVQSYFNGTISKPQRTFPQHGPLFKALEVKEIDATYEYRQGPRLHEESGKRYKISGQHVRYFKWQFSWTMSLARGPVLFDVRFDLERIIYELGLSEIGLAYMGSSPAFSGTASAYTSTGLGSKSSGLIPGVDCPGDAVILNATLAIEDFPEGGTFPNAVCIFEYQLSRPLRRHYSNSVSRGGLFYGGLENYVLVFRTIFVIDNFDYILDYTFFANGALEVKIVPTGYILTEPYLQNTDQGVKLGEYTSAVIHHTAFHFKVDIDISGTSNRYQTISTESDSPSSIKKTLRVDEYDSAYTWDSECPEYHIIFNNHSSNSLEQPRGYRINIPSKSWSGLKNDTAFPWSQYRLAVTKRKSTEETSSSMHAGFDTNDPVVDFRKFMDGDNIVDEDLVAWITLGSLNIPHTEDIPNRVTVGGEQSFVLSPFNYFPEDPSMDSPDAVRLEPLDQMFPQKGAKIERSVSSEQSQCASTGFDYSELTRKGSTVFQTVIGEE